MAIQMRFLQTLSDVGSENNTTIVFPVPNDRFSTFRRNEPPNGYPSPRKSEAPQYGVARR